MNVVMVLIVLVGVVFFAYWDFTRSNAMIAAWAQSNGYKVLEVKRWFLELPPLGMMLTGSKRQGIVKVQVLDTSTQRIRTGFVRLGSYWWGELDFDAVEVRWQDE